jgi:general stress protein 26
MSDTNSQHGNEHQNLSGAEAREKVAALVKGIHICMMNTVGKDGSIDSRPMALQQTPFDGTLWFLTKGSSEKVDEVQQDRHVTLTFAEPSDHKYVTLKGRASVSKDRSKIHELWNNMYKAWFPKGEDDPEITVLRVDVSDGDYWEASSSKLVFYAKYALAAATGGGVPVGESGHVTV